MKVIYKKKLKFDKRKKFIINEKKIMIAIEHPFIGKFYYSFQSATKLYFILEYISGGDLRKMMTRKGIFNEQWTRFYAAELVIALEYLHKKGIIYRDLKAGNIIVNDKGHLKLIDFGLARFLDNNKAYTMCGTPSYIAPEVIINDNYTAAADWWSLVYGIIIIGSINI